MGMAIFGEKEDTFLPCGNNEDGKVNLSMADFTPTASLLLGK